MKSAEYVLNLKANDTESLCQLYWKGNYNERYVQYS